MNLCLIYRITNKINAKIYIGQTWKTLKERFWAHCSKDSSCHYLRNAIKKHGKENFVIQLLTVTSTQEVADYWESYFITIFHATNKKYGYNLKEGGSAGKRTTPLPPRSLATRQRMSDSLKGRQVWNKGLKGVQIAWNKGTKGIMSPNSGSFIAGHKPNSNSFVKGQAPWNKGIPMSNETKQKVSNAKKNPSQQTRQRISAARKSRLSPNKGKPMSAEQKQKLSDAHKGKKWKLIDGKRVYYDPDENI